MNLLCRLAQAAWAKIQWHLNERLTRYPALLAQCGLPLTVVDAFGTPGDTLLTAIVCRELKVRHPRLRLNCITPNPALLGHDPHIDHLNRHRTFFSINFWYLDLIETKDATVNILQRTLAKLGIHEYEYHARVYLTEPERAEAAQRLKGMRRPIVTINAMSREMVKVWPTESWRQVVTHLLEIATVIQIGDNREPAFDGVIRLAGSLSMRESMAVLSLAQVHVGPDSFLMHAANGLDVPSVIIYGGSRPPGCLGYSENTNLSVNIECSPCWLHDSHGDRCPHDIKCMSLITPDIVLAAIADKLRGHDESRSTDERFVDLSK